MPLHSATHSLIHRLSPRLWDQALQAHGVRPDQFRRVVVLDQRGRKGLGAPFLKAVDQGVCEWDG